jgi:hypothetical protein
VTAPVYGYAEGTWTPTIIFGLTSTGVTYADQIGEYTKVGRLVYATFRVKLTSKGTDTTTARVGGLPFSPRFINETNVQFIQTLSAFDLATNVYSVSGFLTIVPGQSVITLQATTVAGTGVPNVTLVETDFTDDTTIQGAVIYQT